jgi:hypothetical protein
MAKKKFKVPKRIAGVKIPKSIRKGPIGTFINSPAGQVLVAEAILVAAGAVGGADPDSPTGQALRHPLKQLSRASRAVGQGRSHTKGSDPENSERFADALRAGFAAFKASLDGKMMKARAGELDTRMAELDAEDDDLLAPDADGAGAAKKKFFSDLRGS